MDDPLRCFDVERGELRWESSSRGILGLTFDRETVRARISGSGIVSFACDDGRAVSRRVDLRGQWSDKSMSVTAQPERGPLVITAGASTTELPRETWLDVSVFEGQAVVSWMGGAVEAFSADASLRWRHPMQAGVHATKLVPVAGLLVAHEWPYEEGGSTALVGLNASGREVWRLDVGEANSHAVDLHGRWVLNALGELYQLPHGECIARFDWPAFDASDSEGTGPSAVALLGEAVWEWLQGVWFTLFPGKPPPELDDITDDELDDDELESLAIASDCGPGVRLIWTQDGTCGGIGGAPSLHVPYQWPSKGGERLTFLAELDFAELKQQGGQLDDACPSSGVLQLYAPKPLEAIGDDEALLVFTDDPQPKGEGGGEVCVVGPRLRLQPHVDAPPNGLFTTCRVDGNPTFPQGHPPEGFAGNDWLLLWQLPTVHEIGMEFVVDGTLYVVITREALRRRDFDAARIAVCIP